jgi:hypothetical protein
MTKLFENAMKSIGADEEGQLSKVPSVYDMGLEDFSELTGKALHDDPAYAIHYAFLFGFVMGNRCTHSRKMKRL